MAKRKLTGNQAEKILAEVLRDVYKQVEGPPVRTRFQRRDYFTLFDFMCLDEDNSIVGVQVSKKYLSSKSKEFKKDWEDWPGRKLYLKASLSDDGEKVLFEVPRSSGYSPIYSADV